MMIYSCYCVFELPPTNMKGGFIQCPSYPMSHHIFTYCDNIDISVCTHASTFDLVYLTCEISDIKGFLSYCQVDASLITLICSEPIESLQRRKFSFSNNARTFKILEHLQFRRSERYIN